MPRKRTPPITPIRLPRGVTGVVVFGGSFDPPHLWHTHIASAARRAAFSPRGGAVVFVPAARSPHKARGPVASNAARLAMLRLATRRLTNAIIWTDELDRSAVSSEPSYTIDTLERLGRALARDGSGKRRELRLLIGSDQAVSFHRWRAARRILRIARPLVALRPPHHTPDDLRRELARTGAWSDPEIARWVSRILPTGIRDHSSTSVRNNMSAGSRSRAEAPIASDLTSAPVRNYILKNGLYRTHRRNRIKS